MILLSSITNYLEGEVVLEMTKNTLGDKLC